MKIVCAERCSIFTLVLLGLSFAARSGEVVVRPSGVESLTTSDLGLDGTDDTLVVKGGMGSLRLSAGSGLPWTGGMRVEGNCKVEIRTPGVFAQGAGLEVVSGEMDFGGFDVSLGDVVVGRGRTRNAWITAHDFTKTDVGDFSVDAGLKVEGVLRVEDGRLNLRPSLAGLRGGVRYCTSGNWTSVYNQSPVFSDFVEAGPMMAYENNLVPDSRWKDYTVASYSGYLWNASSESATCTLFAHLNDQIHVVVNGRTVIASTSRSDYTTSVVNLNPGSNDLYVKMGGKTGDLGAIGGLYTWKTNCFGLVFAQGRVDGSDPSKYVRMVDPGDGSLLTTACCRPGLSKYPDLAMDGGTVDFGGQERAFDGFQCAGCVAGGNVRIDGVWRIPAAQVLVGTPAVIEGDLVFGASATFEISDEKELKGLTENRVVAEVGGRIVGNLPKAVPGRRLKLVKVDEHTIAVSRYGGWGCALIIR